MRESSGKRRSSNCTKRRLLGGIGRVGSEPRGMKRDAFVGLLTAGSLSASPVVAAVSPAAPVPSSGEENAHFARADALITSFMREYEIPAASVAIAKDGRLVHARAFGHRDLAKTRPATPLDRFRIASNSKPITAVAVMLLVERGRLKLDDRAFDVLVAISRRRWARTSTRGCARSRSGTCSNTRPASTARARTRNSMRSGSPQPRSDDRRRRRTSTSSAT